MIGRMLHQPERAWVRIPRMDLVSKNPTGGPNCDARHDATDREAHSARKDGVAASIVKDPLIALEAQQSELRARPAWKWTLEMRGRQAITTSSR